MLYNGSRHERDGLTHIAASPVTPGHRERFRPAHRRCGRQLLLTCSAC